MQASARHCRLISRHALFVFDLDQRFSSVLDNRFSIGSETLRSAVHDLGQSNRSRPAADSRSVSHFRVNLTVCVCLWSSSKGAKPCHPGSCDGARHTLPQDVAIVQYAQSEWSDCRTRFLSDWRCASSIVVAAAHLSRPCVTCRGRRTQRTARTLKSAKSQAVPAKSCGSDRCENCR